MYLFHAYEDGFKGDMKLVIEGVYRVNVDASSYLSCD